jgi:hypothetical protein
LHFRLLFSLVLLLVTAKVVESKAVIYDWKYFDERRYYFRLVMANSTKGETVASMVKRTGGIYGINATYFHWKISSDQRIIVPIGEIITRNARFTVYSYGDRGYVCRKSKDVFICLRRKTDVNECIPAGPVLVQGGILFPYYPCGFTPAFWNDSRIRSVIF